MCEIQCYVQYNSKINGDCLKEVKETEKKEKVNKNKIVSWVGISEIAASFTQKARLGRLAKGEKKKTGTI